MELNHDLTLLDLKDTFQVVDPNQLELPPEKATSTETEPSSTETTVKPYVTSIERYGILQCPLVAGKKVVDGVERVRAALKTGRQFILIRQIGNIVDSVIIVAHSCWVRRPVTVLHEAEMLAGLKIEYEIEHPETTKGGNVKAKKTKKEQSEFSSFCKYVAALTGRDPRTIQKLVKIAGLDEDARIEAHKDTEFANSLDKLYSLHQVGKTEETKGATQLEVVQVWQAQGKKKGKVPDGENKTGFYTLFDCVNEVIKTKKLKDENIAKVPEAAATYQIHHGDFRDVMKKIPDGSIDAVITDPPYLNNYLHLLPAFLKQVVRVLKPNGYAVIMFGQNNFHKLIEQVCKQSRAPQKKERIYCRWEFCDLYSQRSTSLPGIGLACRWKPILICSKHTRKFPKFGPDVIHSKLPEKQWFYWQQSVGTFEELVKRFTKPGDTVLDPFLGSGTTMIAALKHGRNCIGIELEASRIHYTKYRLLHELGLGTADKACSELPVQELAGKEVAA